MIIFFYLAGLGTGVIIGLLAGLVGKP